MNLSERRSGDVTILDLSGKITIGEGDVQLREGVRNLLERGKLKILLNLANVTYIDSSGFGELVHSYTTIAQRNGRLKLEKLPPKLRDLMTITKLLTVFETFDDENEAVTSFN